MIRKVIKPVTLERRAEVQVQLRDSCTPDFDFFLLVVLYPECPDNRRSGMQTVSNHK